MQTHELSHFLVRRRKLYEFYRSQRRLIRPGFKWSTIYGTTTSIQSARFLCHSDGTWQSLLPSKAKIWQAARPAPPARSLPLTEVGIARYHRNGKGIGRTELRLLSHIWLTT